MRIERNALENLRKWKASSGRKPLLMRGARQVGKTTLIRTFAKEFDTYIELNLEKEADRQLFDMDDIHQLADAILLQRKINEVSGTLLLFIDEIQESPQAIKQLRYFYENKPEWHVIAAGSLLEFALSKVPSFPVGRVQYLYLHPLNFVEFLRAIAHQQAIDVLAQVPIPAYAQSTLMDLFHRYIMLGGMPEVVRTYSEQQQIIEVIGLYDSIWKAYKDDVEKYASSETERKVIRHVINTAPHVPDRIKMEGFGNSNYRSREVGEALRALDMARIVRMIYPVTTVEPPLAIDYKKRPRLQILDTGLFNHALSLQGQMIGQSDLSDFYQGKVMQQMVTQELMALHMHKEYTPTFWVREKNQSDAEVDLVFQHGDMLIPIEIKSGKQGTLRSLHQFIDQCPHPYAVRLYGGKFAVEHHTTVGGKKYILMNLPYYLGCKIPEYVEFLVNEKWR